MITLGPLQWLNDRQMVFGHVLPSSHAFVDSLEALYGTSSWTTVQNPLANLTIYSCSISQYI